jgi:predicted enzyme related to lactoylglutathione lyase
MVDQSYQNNSSDRQGLLDIEVFITIAADDFSTVVNFYQQLFSQQPNAYVANVYAEFQLTSLRLGIFKPKNQQEFANSAGSGMSICIEVEDLEAAIAHLSAIGYPPPGQIINASHGKEIYACDPAGNRLILHQS